MALNVGLDVSFGNLQNWKGIQEKSGELIARTLIWQMMSLPSEFSTGVTLARARARTHTYISLSGLFSCVSVLLLWDYSLFIAQKRRMICVERCFVAWPLFNASSEHYTAPQWEISLLQCSLCALPVYTWYFMINGSLRVQWHLSLFNGNILYIHKIARIYKQFRYFRTADFKTVLDEERVFR
jgi:hypothetical protein